MRKFLTGQINYDEYMDKECIALCDVMNCLPGIETRESCSGHGKEAFSIFFRARDHEGLFFLTRCVDRRYWKFGHEWKIELSVGDMYVDDYLPVSFLLHSGNVKGEMAYEQANDLVKNLNYHLNHINFLAHYDLHLWKYKYNHDEDVTNEE